MTLPSPLRLRFDTFDLDEANARLLCNRQPVVLTPKAFAVLCELARRKGDLVTKDALLDAVWGHQHISESVLKTIISQLRAALSDNAKQPRYIETVSRFGYRFIGDSQDSAPAARPAGAATQSPDMPPIVGRQKELQRLRECWDRTMAGARQLVWVVGDAGVGKTTLIESFVRELPPDISVLGRCVEHFGSGEPYMPLLEALGQHCRRDPEIPGIMRAVAPTWLVQLPWLINESDRSALQRELAGTHPDRMVRELGELMNRYTAQRPLLLVIEDLHWSDLGTLRMMEHFARHLRRLRCMWLASFRLTQVIAEDHPLKALRQELRLHKLCEEVTLDPFSESEVGEFLSGRLPEQEFPEDFVRRLHGQTDGLPLFVANVTDTVLTQLAVEPGAAKDWLAAASNLPLPESLAGVLNKQVDRLRPEARTLLEVASICGMDFRAAMVAGMLGLDAGEVRALCDDLVHGHVWLHQTEIVDLPDGGYDARYSFFHALHQQVLYQRVPESLRIRYHRAAARWIGEARDAGLVVASTELASHYERGREILAAIEQYADGARHALGHFAPKDAAGLAAHGIALLDRCAGNTRRAELELALLNVAGIAASLMHGVGAHETRTAFERVRQLCDLLPQTPERALALHGLGWVHYVRGEFDEALALAGRLYEIEAQYPDEVLRAMACNLSGVALVGQGELVAGCEVLERGVAICTRLGDSVSLAQFLIDPEVSMRMNLVFPLADRGLLDAAREHADSGVRRATKIGQPIARMLAHWAGGMLEVRLNNPQAVMQHATALADVVETGMLAQGQGPSLWLRGWAEAKLGAPATGYELIMRGYECHARLGMFAGCPEVLCYASEALILDHKLDAAKAQVADALALAERIGERLILPRAYLLRAQIASAEGDPVAFQDAINASLAEAARQQALVAEQQARELLATHA